MSQSQTGNVVIYYDDRNNLTYPDGNSCKNAPLLRNLIIENKIDIPDEIKSNQEKYKVFNPLPYRQIQGKEYIENKFGIPNKYDGFYEVYSSNADLDIENYIKRFANC